MMDAAVLLMHLIILQRNTYVKVFLTHYTSGGQKWNIQR
jgi:hypothetical protein